MHDGRAHSLTLSCLRAGAGEGVRKRWVAWPPGRDMWTPGSPGCCPPDGQRAWILETSPRWRRHYSVGKARQAARKPAGLFASAPSLFCRPSSLLGGNVFFPSLLLFASALLRAAFCLHVSFLRPRLLRVESGLLCNIPFSFPSVPATLLQRPPAAENTQTRQACDLTLHQSAPESHLCILRPASPRPTQPIHPGHGLNPSKRSFSLLFPWYRFTAGRHPG